MNLKTSMPVSLSGLTQSQSVPHPSQWNDRQLNEWFDSGQYLNGLPNLPDESINRRSFAEHYFDHKEIWDRAFAFLKQTDFVNIALGKIELGGTMYANVDEYLTKDREIARTEVHRKYIDIQYIVSGNELIDVAPLKNLTVTQLYNPEKDVEFGTVTEFSERKASPGRFFIFFPADAHRPCLKVGNDSELIRKVVVKVPVA